MLAWPATVVGVVVPAIDPLSPMRKPDTAASGRSETAAADYSPRLVPEGDRLAIQRRMDSAGYAESLGAVIELVAAKERDGDLVGRNHRMPNLAGGSRGAVSGGLGPRRSPRRDP